MATAAGIASAAIKAIETNLAVESAWRYPRPAVNWINV